MKIPASRLWILDLLLFSSGALLFALHPGHGIVFQISESQRAFIPVSAILLAVPLSRYIHKWK
jgi:hypothetical protein